MRAIALLVALALMLPAGLVLAQAQSQGEEEVTVIVKQRTIMVMEGAEFIGELTAPSAQYWVGKQQVKFDSQIRVRQNFMPEVVGSADAL